jgi:hypothetical protein
MQQKLNPISSLKPNFLSSVSQQLSVFEFTDARPREINHFIVKRFHKKK